MKLEFLPVVGHEEISIAKQTNARAFKLFFWPRRSPKKTSAHDLKPFPWMTKSQQVITEIFYAKFRQRDFETSANMSFNLRRFYQRFPITFSQYVRKITASFQAGFKRVLRAAAAAAEGAYML